MYRSTFKKEKYFGKKSDEVEAKRCQELLTERFNNTNEWRKYMAVVTDAGILHEYERVWNLERRTVIGCLKMKRKKKVIHLKEKYGRKRRIPDRDREVGGYR